MTVYRDGSPIPADERPTAASCTHRNQGRSFTYEPRAQGFFVRPVIRCNGCGDVIYPTGGRPCS